MTLVAISRKYDPSFWTPYWVFQYNQARVTHRSASGNLLTWIIAVEEDGDG